MNEPAYSGIRDEYFDSEVLTAGPIKLVQLMYRGAIDAIGAARCALMAGDIAERSRLITKAMAILNELALSLDHSKDPELCRNLVELYDYMLRRLIKANTEQIEAPLAEVECLLEDILGAWREAGRSEEAECTQTGACTGAGYGEAECERLSYAY